MSPASAPAGLSLRRRVLLVVLSLALLAAFLTALAIWVFQDQQQSQRRLDRLATALEVIAEDVGAFQRFGLPEHGASLSATLSALQLVDAAKLYTLDGQPIYRFGPAGLPSQYDAEIPVQAHGQIIGRLKVLWSAEALASDQPFWQGLALVTLPLVFLVTLAAGWAVERWLTRPVRDLSAALSALANSEHARPTLEQSDVAELAPIVSGFNAVLDRHGRDRARLKLQKRRMARLLDAMTELVLVLDAEGRVLQSNRAAEALLDKTPEGLYRQPIDALFEFPVRAPGSATEILLRDDSRHRVSINSTQGQRLIELSAAPLIVGQAGNVGAVVVGYDVTDARRFEKRLEHEAKHDYLTGLLNRNAFESYVRRRRAEHPTAVDALLFMDLDDFKLINDSQGHLAGDRALREVAEVLRRVLRDTDPLARMGGDEFAVLLQDTSAPAAKLVAEKLRRAIERYGFVDGARQFRLGVSIGIAEITVNDDVEAAHVHADSACYAAKQAGRNRIRLYRADASEATERAVRDSWANRVRQALATDSLRLFVQPILPAVVEPGAREQLELFVRYQDEGSGRIHAAADFMAAVRRYRLGADLDRWVSDRLLQALAAMPEQFARTDVVWMNLTQQSFNNSGFMRRLVERIEAVKAYGPTLGFDLTESHLIGDSESIQRRLAVLREAGAKIAIDHFGDELASFSLLKSLPLDMVKLDPALSGTLADDHFNRHLVRAICQLAHDRGLHVTAGGMESSEQIDQVQAVGVDFVQGHALLPPQPLVQWMQAPKGATDLASKKIL